MDQKENLKQLLFFGKKFVQVVARDLHEIANLQNSHVGLQKFCDASIERMRDFTIFNLSKIFRGAAIYDYKDIYRPLYDGDADCKTFVVVELPQMAETFMRSLPFSSFSFSIMLDQSKGGDEDDDARAKTLATIIYIPHQQELIFAAQGAGAWSYNINHNTTNRLRISGKKSNIDNIVFVDNVHNYDQFSKSQDAGTVLHPESLIFTSNNHGFNICQLAAAKADYVISDISSANHTANIIAAEAGVRVETKGKMMIFKGN